MTLPIRVQVDRDALGAAVTSAMARAIEHVPAAPTLLLISQLVQAYEHGALSLRELLTRLARFQ